MGYPVTYYCPHCETLVEVQREGYLNDKAVTPYPLEGWTYVDPDVAFGSAGSAADVSAGSADREPSDADGVRFVCGESAGVTWAPETAEMASETVDGNTDATGTDDDDRADVGCGEPFYLSFVRFEDGREVDPRSGTSGERIRLNLGREPDSPRGPTGPSGPDGGSGGFWG
ncbi:hypothetical protein [Halopenitus persicus]|uniref:hypothetical protein n=1 Tax=Halopenitus persicus TaxID=1048396 RepID=UPI000BBB4A3A|nr:hypothetical protein [Halopenitus persicus]